MTKGMENSIILDEHTKLDSLSKKNSDCLKGIFAFCVLIHHLYQQSGMLRETIIGNIFQAMGYLSVAVFYFLSGYGLMASYRKSEKYICCFPRKRILPFYCIILLLTVLYAIEKDILGTQITLPLIIKSLTFGATTISSGWYLQVQLLFYILFWVIFKICRSTKIQLISISIASGLYCLCAVLLHFSTTWYESILTFVCGMIWCICKEKTDTVLEAKEKWIKALLISLILFCLTFIGTALLPIKALQIISKIFSANFFVMLVLVLTYRIKIDFAVTRLLGKLSFEIYVTQGLCFVLYHSIPVYVENPYLFVVLSFISTLILARMLHPVNCLIYTVCGGRKIGNKN